MANDVSNELVSSPELDRSYADEMTFAVDAGIGGKPGTPEERFALLLTQTQTYFSEPEQNTLKRAFDYACTAHQGQCRKSGEPYISHPVEVALILASLRMDVETLTAALLHDVVEDTDSTYDDVAAEFGDDVAQLVDGVTKISRIEVESLTAAQAAWLNSMNAYDAVKAKVGTIGLDAFLDAWLLNLDLREEPLGSGALKVSGIEVTETEVKVSVKLERTGAMQNAAINGVLKLYGGTSLDVMAPLNETPVTNEDFASGDTALFVYPRSGEAKFFRPAIRQR